MPSREREPPGVLPASTADAADLAVFLSRAVTLDPAALVRLRSVGDRVAGYLVLPFGVLVSRSAAGRVAPADITVGAADLLAALDRVPVGSPIGLPPRRDADWRGALPPAADWQRLDSVPAAVVRQLVRAGGETLRATGAAGTGGEGLLGHEALTVSGAGRTVVLPLRVLSAAWRMGFLGPEVAPEGAPAGDAVGPIAGAGPTGERIRPAGGRQPGPGQVVVVSAVGAWARLAAPYGSAYHRVTPELGVLPA
jgi:hypothetical protein